MTGVTRFESNLLTILRCFLRRVPLEQALPLVARELPAPPCLSSAAVRLVQDSLAKGTALVLARDGGWRRERFLRGDRIADGRLWERTPPAALGLTFSRQAMEFLIWITAHRPVFRPPAVRKRPAGANRKQAAAVPELGDRLLFFLAYEALRNTEYSTALLQYPAFANDGLLCLAFPDDFAAARIDATPQFGRWLLRDGTCLLEAFQSRLADRWVEIERQKHDINDWQQLDALGQFQDRALTRFLSAIDGAGRRDLARFMLTAAASILRGPADRWFEKLNMGERRLADRAETYRAGLCFLHRLVELEGWEREARTIGYLDEGYVASQLWKSDWERLDGDELCRAAREIIGRSRY